MLNLLKSRKAQFYIISVVGIVTILYGVGKSLTSYSIIDTSEVVLRDEFFVFNNIVEKTFETINAVKSCEDLRFNLEEFELFVSRAFAPRYIVNYNFTIVSCNDAQRSATIIFDIELSSFTSLIKTTFSKDTNW